jgi:MoxR-like ATPase
MPLSNCFWAYEEEQSTMTYRKRFDPKPTETFTPTAGTTLGDRRDGSAYVYSDEIVLAVNVGLATGRPLLVRGPSGSGKSSLARSISRVLGWRYYEKVISSRTQARDLLWEVDLLRRLQDAQARKLSEDFTPYIKPGVFWWAFDRESARRRGAPESKLPIGPPPEEPGEGLDVQEAVVLLDEIDKADPDVPNNLLVPLGSLRFQVEETGAPVQARKAPLVVITTNDERALPAAFLRRCIELVLKKSGEPELIAIGRAHFGEQQDGLLKDVAQLITKLSGTEEGDAPSPAEYLDAVRASIELNVKPGSEQWEPLSKITVWKHGRSPSRP